MAWIEVRRGRATTPAAGDPPALEHRRTVLVRVAEAGRIGWHRSSGTEPADLERAVRAAMAQARAHEALPGMPHLPADPNALPLLPGLHDPEIASWDPAGAAAWLRTAVAPREGGPAELDTRATLRWCEAAVVVSGTRGLRRQATVTTAALAARCGSGLGAGRAAAAARSLAGLDVTALVERAQARAASAAPAAPPAGPCALWLAPEAAATLLDAVSRIAFVASAYLQGTSLLRDHLGVQVFDRRLSLRDDALAAAGLPFPFDLEGTVKRPLDLVVEGVPRAVPLDHRHAALLGLPATGHAAGGDEARAENLFLLPGEDTALAQAADGGLWAAAIERLELWDPRRARLRAVLRGVRRVAGGALAEPVPDLVWEDDLLRALAGVAALGAEPVCLAGEDLVFGGTCAPDLVLAEVVACAR